MKKRPRLRINQGQRPSPSGRGYQRRGEVAVPTMLREQKGSVSQPEACLKSARCDFDASVGGQISIGGSATLTGERLPCYLARPYAFMHVEVTECTALFLPQL